MKFLVLRCGSDLPVPGGLEVHDVAAVPSRQELRLLDQAAAAVLPEDPTPSLDEIAAQPDVRHLGEPGFAPQPVPEALRTVVIGTDAALSAVLTRAMRADYMWVEFAFIPVGDSTAAKNWGLPNSVDEQWELALEGSVNPAPLIRNDAGIAVAGSAVIANWDDQKFIGEIVVDSNVLVRQKQGLSFGARLVPTSGAPGIAAVKALGPLHGAPGGFWQRLRRKPGAVDPNSVTTGRAVQAGGPQLRVIVDGISHKRAVDRVTFYRHLRDLQVVRPS